MDWAFVKYEAAGNDFILLSDVGSWAVDALPQPWVARVCQRRYGIGADGLMVVRPHPAHQVTMTYYNADGLPGSLCGNGGRAAMHYARALGWLSGPGPHILNAYDGPHETLFMPDAAQVRLQMQPPTGLRTEALQAWWLNSGSPHYVELLDTPAWQSLDISTRAMPLRYGTAYAPGGTNVNFLWTGPDGLHLRTYERGVEAETLSCGTGATAAAWAWAHHQGLQAFDLTVRQPGGTLRVVHNDQGLWLQGPATPVFSGVVAAP